MTQHTVTVGTTTVPCGPDQTVLDALLRGDIEKRSKAQTTYLQNGVFNIDEVRKMENKPPLPNGLGKIHRVQVSTMEVGAEPAPEPAAPPAAEPEGE